jgi:para-nitrobenzyl esterase
MDLLADLGTDETFLLPAMRLAESVAARGGNAYAYLFNWAAPGSRFKSCHCIDLPFVFGNPDAWHNAAMLAGGDAAQMADLSAAMRHAWIAFVRNGDPAQNSLPSWPRHETGRRQTMRLGARIGVLGDPACIGA